MLTCMIRVNICFNELNIFFSDKKFVLLNTDLEYKKVLSKKYLFYWTLLYSSNVQQSSELW